MSSYDKVVKSATKPKGGGIKPKYIDPILATTFTTDGSLQSVCTALAQRLRDPNNITQFKCLIIIHTMARNGEVDNVLSHLSSESANLRLRHVSGGYDYGASLTPYAQYLDERLRAYRELRHDVIRSSEHLRAQLNNSNSNRLRRLTVEKGLLREVSITQKVANALLQCPFFHDDLNDELTMSAFRMSLKDLLAMYTVINEGVINILEHYFEMAKTDAERALELYKRFCRQTEKVVAYLNSAKKAAFSLNIAIPSLRHAPVSLAGALEEYLNDPNFEQNRQEYKENKKIADGTASKPTTPSPASSVPKSESKKSITIKEPEKPERPVKPPTNNQALQDFFASIDNEQGNAFSNLPVEQSYFGVVPQQTGMGFGIGSGSGMGMAMGTGMAGGLQPQMTGYNPFLNQGGLVAPQMMGMPQMPMATGLGMQQQQQSGFLQAQPTGFLQAQPTGFNPFRQSLMPQATGMGGPFGQIGGQGLPSGQQPQQQQNQQQPQLQQQQQQQQVQPQATGTFSSNAFSGAAPLQNNASSNALSAFNSAFGGVGQQQQQQGSAAPAGRVTSPKPLLPQKTGSRNPFAPPPGQTPPASPPPATKTGPSLNELAINVFASSAPNGGHYGLGANAWNGSKPNNAGDANSQPQPQGQGSGLKPQPTGLIGNIASEFAFVNRQNAASPAPGAPSTTTNTLTSNLDSLSLGGSGTLGGSSSVSTPSLQPQPTGFGGSTVKPFKPESSFGASLAANPAFAVSSSGPLAPQATGNPFARISSPQPQQQQQPSGAGGAGSTGLLSQPTGFGSIFNPSAFGASTTTTTNNVGQTAASGSSLFGATNGATTGLPASSTSSTTPFSTTALGASSSLSSSVGPLQAQPTGFGGIKPFQPTSNFGQSTFGTDPSLGVQPQQQPQQQQQQEPNLLQF
ncbi:hypothetical protein ACQY0O_002190 [Thecaphora frezii]